ncbi:hypothetical protein [Streptacidiphilus anmyonensis]|uniref:hypothetical protein n=1 Tax=Streptacidiphilus anmyonensis TaxID=405782 RepID=UPI0005AAF959|nr:hypothetical protein [Streptacidiphilus anmyonensis]
MPANTSSVRICPTCDGFPVVAISIGPRALDGSLPTLPVICLHCSGTGNVPANDKTPMLAPAGR